MPQGTLGNTAIPRQPGLYVIPPVRADQVDEVVLALIPDGILGAYCPQPPVPGETRAPVIPLEKGPSTSGGDTWGWCVAV